MRATAVIPIKRFSAAKQRLAPGMEAADRAILAEAMLADVLAALRRSTEIERVIVVSDEPGAAALAEAAGAEVIEDPADAGHSEATMLGVAAALAGGASCAALLAGDCPLLDPAELDTALAAVGGPSVTVIADRHGTGTNGLLLSPPDAIRPSFGPGSCERHLGIAADAGVPAKVTEAIPSMGLDLDTPDDLGALRQWLGRDPGAAPRTAEALLTLAEVS